jgi:hypothetical protein
MLAALLFFFFFLIRDDQREALCSQFSRPLVKIAGPIKIYYVELSQTLMIISIEISKFARPNFLQMKSSVNKQFLLSTIVNTESHNRREEEADCWRQHLMQKRALDGVSSPPIREKPQQVVSGGSFCNDLSEREKWALRKLQSSSSGAVTDGRNKRSRIDDSCASGPMLNRGVATHSTSSINKINCSSHSDLDRSDSDDCSSGKNEGEHKHKRRRKGDDKKRKKEKKERKRDKNGKEAKGSKRKRERSI